MSENNILGPQTGLVDLLLESIESDNAKAKAEGKGWNKTPIRPSNAGKCARELYFDLMAFSGRAKYETEGRTGEVDLLLDLGHSVEYHLLKKLKKHFSMAEVKYQQQVVDFGYIDADDKKLAQHLEGSIDLVFWSDKWKCCADVKSKGDRWDWQKRKTKWDADSDKLANMKSVKPISKRAFWVDNLDDFLIELKDPFFEANFRQLNMYCNSQFIKDRGIEFGAIIQYQKNASKLREIRFRPSQTVQDAVVAKFRNVVAAVDKQDITLAPAEYPSESFKARYCDYCKSGVKGSCANK